MANSPSGESVTERVVRILDTFSTDRTLQTPAEIARRARLASSTSYRLVSELTASGLLERDEDGRVRLGLRLWELALRGSAALRLRQAALPDMARVQSRVREHTHLAVLEQDEALFLERLSHPRAGSNIAHVAGRLPLHASSAGLVLLAHAEDEVRERVLRRPLRRFAADTVTDPAEVRRILRTVARDGYVVARGTVETVSTGVAVPVRGPDGQVLAALGVVLPHDAPTAGAVEALREAAAAISAALKADHR